MAADSAQLAALIKQVESRRNRRRIPKLQRDLFDQQRALLADPCTKKAALCSRRSGKTVAAAYALGLALEESKIDDVVVYLARTRAIAKGLIWNKLKELQRRWKLPWQFREVDLQVVAESGGMIQVSGLDKEAEIEKLRGIRARLVVLDEPATYTSLIGRLVAEVLEPALGDLEGTLLAVGTPGVICDGWWYDVSGGKHPSYSVHHWTIRDNPYFPNAERYLRKRRLDNDWDENHPTYLREDCARWVQDDTDLVYKFKRDRNVVRELPELDEFCVGCDFGVNDASAWAVVGWKKGDPRAYVVEARQHAGLLPDEAAVITKRLVDRYSPRRLVGDSQGLGKPYVEQFNRRYDAGIQMIPADKGEKRAHIELLNGEFRTARFLIKSPEANPLLDELTVLGWNPKRTDSDGNDHCCDAMLYAWRHSTAYRDQRLTVQRATNLWDLERILEEEDERLFAEEADRDWWDDEARG